MKATEVSCLCGAVKLRLAGKPLAQFYCDCEDCQVVHGAACVPVAMFPSEAVTVTRGEATAWTYKAVHRHRCARCGTQLFAVMPGTGFTGVKGNLLPPGMFRPRQRQARPARRRGKLMEIPRKMEIP
jgi:hypothetical protein